MNSATVSTITRSLLWSLGSLEFLITFSSGKEGRKVQEGRREVQERGLEEGEQEQEGQEGGKEGLSLWKRNNTSPNGPMKTLASH